jgi:HAD superfamily hydrolase (TIGR01509 family)
MRLPPGKFSAYLFDCDGTIADSMPLHFEAWARALSPWGCPFPVSLFRSWAGLPVPATVERLNEKYGLNMPVAEVTANRERFYAELLPRVKPVPFVLRQIQENYGKLPLAVVSGSPRASVLKTLGCLGLTEKFQAVVGGEDTTRGKPHPDPFLLAARKLGVAPASCLVFEDADLGIQAAQAAGMRWVRVTADLTEPEGR